MDTPSEQITTYAAIRIMGNALTAMDARLLEHGQRTAYMVNKILQYQNKYTDEQIYDFTLIGLMHDIGAYKTDDIGQLMDFEFDQVWAHSIYGYLYLKYLSPVEDYGQILLYHHLDYTKMTEIQYPYMDVAAILRLSDRMELFLRGDRDSKEHMERFVGKKYSPEIIQMFYRANEAYGILPKLKSGEYREELDAQFRSLDWGPRKTEALLRLLLYVIDFKNEYAAVRMLSTSAIAAAIARYMDVRKTDMEALRYASYVYDLGMLHMPDELLELSRKLTPREYNTIKTHVDCTGTMIGSLVPQSIYDIAFRHHERLDGTGYPDGLEHTELTLPQRILAVADTIAAMMSKTSYRDALSRRQIVASLEDSVESRKLDPVVVRTAIVGFDEIADILQRDADPANQKYKQIKEQFDSIIRRFDGL